MSKNYIVIVLIFLVFLLAGGGYVWITGMQKSATVVLEDTPKNVIPTSETVTAIPTESVESANPYDKTNPFSDIKTNPFE